MQPVACDIGGDLTASEGGAVVDFFELDELGALEPGDHTASDDLDTSFHPAFVAGCACPVKISPSP